MCYIRVEITGEKEIEYEQQKKVNYGRYSISTFILSAFYIWRWLRDREFDEEEIRR